MSGREVINETPTSNVGQLDLTWNAACVVYDDSFEIFEKRIREEASLG